MKKLDPERSMAENAARIVRVRLEEMQAFAPRALDETGIEEQHEMRIAAKRLRYVLELTEFCLGRPASVARRRARDLQGVLGEMRDCDVMMPRVRERLDELRSADAQALRRRAEDAEDLDPAIARTAPSRTAYRGLEVLLVYLEARRELLYDRFRGFWADQEQAGTWDRLDRAARRQLDLARRRRAAERQAERARVELEQASAAEREARERAVEAEQELEQTGFTSK